MSTSDVSQEVKEFYEAVALSVQQLPEPDTGELVDALGVRMRLNLKHAFVAAAKGVAAVASAANLMHGNVTPTDLGGGAAALTFWSSFLDAIRQKMTALEYVACVAISQSPDGAPISQFKEVVGAFILKAGANKQAWWLRLSEERLADAKLQLNNTSDVEDFVNKMVEKGWATNEGGSVKVRSRNFTLGITGE